MTSFRKNFVSIDEEALRRNVRALKRMGGQPFCPMVKANAYGMGAIPIARILREEKVSAVGVALVEEALELRSAGDQDEIWLFGAFTDVESAGASLQAQITPVIGTLDSLHNWCVAVENLAQTGQSLAAARIILDLNTGMNRLGLSVERADERAELVGLLGRLGRASRQSVDQLIHSAMTHFVDGEDPLMTSTQLEKFQACLELIEAELTIKIEHLHTANSAGLWGRQDARFFDLQTRGVVERIVRSGSRPGIALYGALETLQRRQMNLESVVTWTAELAHVRRVNKGESVSYGAKWVAKRDSLIGVVACGYADGYRRGMQSPEVLIAGHRAPVVGTICMDYFMVDLTDAHDRSRVTLRPGSMATLLGSDVEFESEYPSIEVCEMANWAQTVPYEILTGLSSRVPRVFQTRGKDGDRP